MEFKDQVVLITGASSGIGRRLAIDLAEKGAVVIGCGRSEERLAETLSAMRRFSPSSSVLACDVGSLEEVKRMVQSTLSECGRVDILINNAGFGAHQPLAESSPNLVEEMMRTNYLGTVYCTQQILPSMIQRGSGHIVNISSVSGMIGTPNMASYCATKFALMGLSESLYHELRPLGIHVSVICPGPVRTNFRRLFNDIAPKPPAFLELDAEVVSRAVIQAIEKKRFEVILPRFLAGVCFFKRLMPNFFRLLTYRVLRSQYRGQIKKSR